MKGAHDLADAARRFRVDGNFLTARSHGSGHINHSYCVSFEEGGLINRYLLQHLNTNIFKDPGLLMENVQRVTSHVATKLAGTNDVARRVLTLIHTHDGHTWHREVGGSCWRMFRFIENARAYDWVESTTQALEAAKAFGSFQQLLADMPAPRLHDSRLPRYP